MLLRRHGCTCLSERNKVKHYENTLKFTSGSLHYSNIQVFPFKILLKHGANPNADSALHIACDMNDELVALMLLRHGADSNKPDMDDMNSPLHLAARNGCLKLCFELIKRQADPKAKNRDNLTPAMVALRNNNLDIIMLLFSMGTRLANEIDSTTGDNLIHLAIQQKNFKCIVDLAMRGVDPKFKNNSFLSPKAVARKLGILPSHPELYSSF
jgi:ankyrin repeat protein